MFAFFSAADIHAAAGEDQKAEKRKVASEVLRQDILRFVGPVTDDDVKKATIPDDCILVQLPIASKSHLNNSGNKKYGMLVRRLDVTEKALLEDALDGKWDQFNLFSAALVAEGVRDHGDFQNYEEKINSVLSTAQRAMQTHPIEERQNQAILTQELFESLHRNLLTKPYNINCTHLSDVLKTGHFNCVSATVLFNVLGEKMGLDVCALEMPGHALSRVKFGQNSMDLETTCPNWFSLQTEIARREATMSRIASAPQPMTQPAMPLPATTQSVASPSNQGGQTINASQNSINEKGVQSATTADSIAELSHISKKLREISPVQLIATIYYNQGVDLLEEKRYAEAASANIKALLLDPASETARGNLLATINNWAIELTTASKRYDLAATLLDQGVGLDPTYDKFRANQLHVYYHWIRELALEGRVEDAKTVFLIADQRLPGDSNLKNLMEAIDKSGQ
ncbi:MAG: hypothetical protein ACRCUY_05325 [Thermoguttaceae bacterium]